MHEHPIPEMPKPCEHEFKYCKKCDTVYCEKCKAEWTRKVTHDLNEWKQAFEKYERQRPRPMWPNPEMWPKMPKVWCKESHS